jgi:hypothetical protein
MEEQSLGMGIAIIVCFVVVPVLSWILSELFKSKIKR